MLPPVLQQSADHVFPLESVYEPPPAWTRSVPAGGGGGGEAEVVGGDDGGGGGGGGGGDDAGVVETIWIPLTIG